MGKGNMLLGYARGSVGDVTFTRVKGQQVARARNRQPNNPRTLAQMSQRATFVGAVKFYTSGVQRLFKFAFENKRERESDYNAFMRYNARRSPLITKAMAAAGVMAPSDYIVSRGSLKAEPYTVEDNVINMVTIGFNEEASTGYGSTVGGLSTYLINQGLGDWQNGDIFTAYVVNTVTPSSTIDGMRNGLLANNIGPQAAVVAQYILNTSSTDNAPFVSSQGSTPSLNIFIPDLNSDQISGTVTTLVALVHSRNTDSGLKVSNSEFVVVGPQLPAAMSAERYKEAVLQDWCANPDALLQGNA